MPQNAIIRANGTGDYTTIIAWEAAEQSSNYGSITVGRVDGFFDQGGTALIITGGFPNGARLEPFDSADAVDGTERQLCGLTSSQGNRSIRCRQSITVEIDGLEIYNTGSATAGVVQSDNFGPVTVTNSLVKAAGSKIHQNCILDNCVMVSTAVSSADPVTATNDTTNCSIFFDSTDNFGQGSTATCTNTFIYNAGTGGCFDATVTQSNNGSTDATADTETNVVISSNFVDPTPVASGDYRISAGSDLANANIGASIQSSGGGFQAAWAINANKLINVVQ